MALWIAFFVVTVWAAPAGAQPLEVGTAAKVDQVFARFDSSSSPGCAVGIYRDGQSVYARAYGMANLDHDVPLTPGSVFHVASVSKQFTAAAIVLLAIEGKLSLDDEVRKHLPELPDFGHRITLRHLVHHTSGLRDQWALLGLAGWRYSRDLITDEDVVEMMARQQDLNFPPGERHLYCNTGYTLLGQIVKRVSGESLREFTTRRIFGPLGMKNTHFRDDHAEIVKNQAYGYVPAGKSFRLSMTNFDTVGATSLLTTVEDLAHWDGNFVNNTVGGARFLEQIVERGVLASGEKLNYAFGLVHGRYKGLRTVAHGGSDAGYRSSFVRFPDQRTTIATLCNLSTSNPGSLVNQVADIVLSDAITPGATEELTDRPEVPVTAAELASYAGVYWNASEETGRRFVPKDGTLYEVFGDEQRRLRSFGGGSFRTAAEGPRSQLQFETGTDGRLRVSVRSGAAQTGEVFDHGDAFTPRSAEMAAFAGVYRSEEIDAVYRIVLEKEALVLKRLKVRPATLEPMIKDVFRGGPGTLRFTRRADGQVTGFVLHAGRVRNVRFFKDRR